VTDEKVLWRWLVMPDEKVLWRWLVTDEKVRDR
jgi:hypothetical protein